MRFEQLEERSLLSATSLTFSAPLDDSATISLDPVVPAAPRVKIDAAPTAHDAGDFYWYFSQKMPLLRSDNEILVKLASSADKSEVIDALLANPGVTLRSDVTASLDPQTLVISKLTAAGIDSYEALKSLASSLTGVAWTAPVFAGADGQAGGYLTGNIEIALRRDVDPATFFDEGFSGWRRIFDNQYVATVSAGGMSAFQLANELHSDPRVEWAQPSFAANLQLSTNDPLYSDEWHLNNTGQTGAKIDADSDLQEAWNVTTGGPQVVLGVLDIGVQTNHPDLNIFVNSGEIAGNGVDDDQNGFIDDVNGWDFAGDTGVVGSFPDNNPNPTTQYDNHGTAVAGVAGALGNNSVGVTGAAQNVKILPIKIARQDTASGGGFIPYDQIAKAVYYAAGIIVDASGVPTGATWRGADILVNSWGGNPSFPDATLTAAFDYIQTHGRNGLGVASFNAAGNSAAGTTAGLNYQTFTLNGVFPGNWVFEWRYTKDSSAAAGEDSLWLGNMKFPNGTSQRFDTAGLPAGWSTSDNVGWSVVDDPAHAYGTGRYVAKAGAILDSQTSNLRSPTIAVSATGSLSFSYWVSSEAGFDGMSLWYSVNGGAFTQQPNFFRSGVPIVTAPVAYPANIASTIAVGASTDWDYRSMYSQYGSALDFVAPSSGGYGSIYTTDRTGDAGYNATGTGDQLADPLADTNYTSLFSGTSSATPLAAGIAALMLSANPNLTPATIRSVMQNTADKIGGNNGATAYSSGFNQYYGYGRVNALGAVYNVFTPLAPQLDLGSNSGSTSDTVTNDNTPTITGTVPANSFVQLYIDNVADGTYQAMGGGTTFSIPTGPLSSGMHTFKIKVAADASVPSGNFSNFSSELSVTIDTGLPTIPGSLDLAATSDSGTSSTDNITNDTTPTFTWSASSDGIGSGILGYYYAVDDNTPESGGMFITALTATPSVSANSGHTIYVRAVDVAGNLSSVAPLSFTIDTAFPTAPGSLDLATASDSGSSSTDNITNDTTPTFNWTASGDGTGSGVSGYYYAVDDSTPESGGVFTSSLTATPNVPANSGHWVYVRAMDVAGNLGSVASLPFTIDTMGPQVTNVILSSTAAGHPTFSFDDPNDENADFDGSGIQLKTVPVGNVNQVSLQFSEAVENITTNSLSLPRLMAGGTPITPVSTSYNSSTRTERWTFSAPAPADWYIASLVDTVTDTAGNQLDGEWTNPYSLSTQHNPAPGVYVSTFPSGDGVPGGAFNFVATILPGDANQDNRVDGADFLIWQLNNGGSGKTFSQGDFNGDGLTNSSDLTIYQANSGMVRQTLTYADFNADGAVDSADLSIWQTNNGTGTDHAHGDADNDGDVDGDDFLIWQRQLNYHLTWVA